MVYSQRDECNDIVKGKGRKIEDKIERNVEVSEDKGKLE